MRATPPAPSLGDWPADGLERVDRCPACASPERSLLYSGVTDRSYMCAAGRWNVFRCGECASAFLDPRPTKETVHLAYGNYYEGATSPAAFDDLRWLRRIRRAIRNGYLNARYGYRLTPASHLGRLVVPLVPRQREMADEHVRHLRWRPGRPRLLDVGCGEGEFVAEMTKLGWAAEGIDPTVEAVAAARRAGVKVTKGDLTDVALDEDAFDAITFRLVFEHIPDPAAALRACHRALKRGGVLWIAAPNLDSEASRMFGDAWIFLEPPRHAVLYTPSSLMQLLRRYEIAPVAMRGSGRAGWSFRLSRAIAHGEPPFRKPRPLSLPEHARVLLADVRGRLRPERADVVVIIGQKR